MSLFKKATRTQSKLRMALQGPPGSGKTKSALRIAEGLGDKIAVIDTERGSSRKYAKTPTDPSGHTFEVVEVMDEGVQKLLPKPNFHPDNAVFLLNEAAKDHDVVIVDSFTHFWNGLGGFLDLVNDATARMVASGKRADSFAAWRDIDPIYRRLINTILNCPAHVITCLRAKQEYEKKDGKVIKLGMGPEVRDGYTFEMDIEGMLDENHNLAIGKTRCMPLDGRVFNKPGTDVADIIKQWLSDGEPTASVATSPAAPETHANPVQSWLSRIGNAASLPELEVLADEIRKLDGGMQSQLIGPYKAKKGALQTQ